MIAIAGPNLPLELLTATGRHAGVVGFDPDLETPRADRWLESKFAPWARAVLEGWAQGAYDDLDQVLFSRADDTSQRLYYYVCELQRRGLLGGPEAIVLDIAKIPRRTSLDRTVEKLREMGERLCVSEEALEKAIVASHDRAGDGSTAPGEGRVCLLAGTNPPDMRLHEAVARAGFRAAGRTLAQEWLDPGAPAQRDSGDPYAALGRKLHARGEGPRSFADPAAALRAGLAASGAEAVVLWRIEEDEAQCWHLPQERAAIEASGLPSLILTRRDWLGRDGSAAQIESFLREVSA